MTTTQPTLTTEFIVYDPRERMLYVRENKELGIPAHATAFDVPDLAFAKMLAITPTGVRGDLDDDQEDLDFIEQPDGTWAAEFQRPIGVYLNDSEYADCHFCLAPRGYRHSERCHYAHLNPPKSTSKLFVWVDQLNGNQYCYDHAGVALSSAIDGAPRTRRHTLWSGDWVKTRVDHADHVYCESKGCKTRPAAD